MRGTAGLLVACLLTAGLAGCVGDEQITPQSDEPGSTGPEQLPGNVSMQDAETVEQTPSRIVFLWETPAPVSTAGAGPQGDPPAVETTIDVPADRFLSLSVNATVLNDADAAGWRMQLLDADGKTRCADIGGNAVSTRGAWALAPTTTRCTIDTLQPLTERETWTLRIEVEQNPTPDATVASFLELETIEPGPLHEVSEVLPFETDADDGTTLRGHVYVPTGEGPFPTILNYSPYHNIGLSSNSNSSEQATERGDRTTLPGWMGTFLEDGYAIALVNLRGTGTSDGCNVWFDPEVDGADAASVIDVLGNASFSDGTVGMVGLSWPGYSQYAALLEQPEPLKAVAPASAILDTWTLWTRRGPTITSQFGPMATTYATFQAITGMGPGDQPRHVRCPSYADHLAAHNQLSADGDKSPYFEQRTTEDILANNSIPMLVSNGLQKVGEGHILQIDGLWPVMNEDSRLLVGQWPHAYPDATPTGEDYWQVVLDWMDHHLKGDAPAQPAGVVDYQDKQGTWHRADAWPPSANETRLFLSDGTLVTDEDDIAASQQAFQVTDDDPRPDTCPGDKALYVSPPLAEDVLLAGNYHANLTVTSTQPDGQVSVFLWHVDELASCPTAPDPFPLLDYPKEVSRAISDLSHRGHLEQGEPFPVGQPGQLAMSSHPFAAQVSAGERLVLAVTGGAVEVSPSPAHPQIVVQTGDSIEATVDLPVVEGQLVFEGSSDASRAPLPDAARSAG